MRSQIASLVLLLIAVPLIAGVPDTAWTRTYPGPYGTSFSDMLQTEDGGYILCGNKNYGSGWGENNSWLVRTNAIGETLWTRTWAVGTLEEFRAIDRTSDGNFILAAYHDVGVWATEETGLMKVSANGDSLWCRKFDLFPGRDNINDVASASDGGYFLIGTCGGSVDVCDLTVAKFDAAGAVIWTRQIHRDIRTWAQSVVAMPDGGCVVAGDVGQSWPSPAQALLMRMSANGDIQWERTYGSADRESFGAVQITSDGGFIMAGATLTMGTLTSDIYLVRTDALGNPLWIRSYGTPLGDQANTVYQTQDGGFITGGQGGAIYGGAIGYWIIRMNANGDLLWQTPTDYPYGFAVRGVLQTDDLGFMACTYYGASLVKYEPEQASAGYVTLVSAGPPDWEYRLHWQEGDVDLLVFSNLYPGTLGSVIGEAALTGWAATSGNNFVMFTSPNALSSGSLSGFVLSCPTRSDLITWVAGDSSGYVDGPLPVELLSFTALPGNGSVTLEWKTASETDNDYFEILRNDEIAARISSRGNTASGHEYSWTDAGLENGSIYAYTLIAVDLNGAREELSTIEATPTESDALITEYALQQNFPNPFNANTEIEYSLRESGRVTLTIYNATGQLVKTLVDGYQSADRYHVSFNAGDLASGIYLYKLEVNDFTAIKKMVLMK
ncbi:T9SS type A sorting domain-containing protein [bacterium]|nr:T9SS type A sorting domain-containing protein [bacterium]MBU1984927.1 T9SS type A sorting domain-containing protein [bacterium]